MLPVQNDVYTPIVTKYLRIDDTTWGDGKKGFLVRYRGQLYNHDSALAYDQLAQALRPQGVTPLFRMDGKSQAILLMNGVIQTKPSKIWPNIVFFLLTVLSVTFTGAVFSATTLPTSVAEWPGFLASGLPFTLALMAILVCHEFGHYLVGRYHKNAVTLPFFIPLPYPISYFGTLGAFIQMKEPPKNKRILLDIGIAGPLAGLIVAIPILLYGLSISKVGPIPAQIPLGQIFEGNSILYLVLKYIVTGQWLPHPATYGGLNPLLYWIRFIFTGKPLPAGGVDVMLNPVAWAGWIGLLVTSINLIPAGMLDGGHIIYVLLGKNANKILPFILIALIALTAFVSISWLLPTLIIFLIGRYHAEPLDQITPLDNKRRLLAIFGVIVFILVFIPVPFA